MPYGLMQLGQTAVNAGMGLFNQMLGKENMHYAYTLGERTADNADRRTRALYSDLYSPQAQMEQFKNAGLSPSLMAGQFSPMSGQGGAQGGNVSAVNPQATYSPDMMAGAMQQEQIELLKAQVKNLNADTDKKQGETASIYEGIKQMTANTAKIWAEKGAVEASTALTKAQTTGQELVNEITNATKDEQIKAIAKKNNLLEYEIEKAIYTAEREHVALKLDKATFIANVDKAKEEVKKIATDIAKANKDMQLTDQQIIQIVEELGIAWQELAQKGDQIEINRQNLATIQDQFDRNMRYKWVEMGVNVMLETNKNVFNLLGNVMKLAMIK